MTAAIGRLTTSITRQYPIGDLVGVRLPIAVLLILPLFAPALLPTSRLLSLAVTAAIYVMVANGLHIVFSYTGQLSLAQSTLWGLGAYAAALLVIHYDIPTVGLIPAAGLVGALGAVAIGVPAFRTAGFSFAIITFAFAEIMRVVGNNWWSLTNGNTGLIVTKAPDAIGPVTFDTISDLPNFYYLTLGFAYLSVVGVLLIRQSWLGRTFIAIRENEALARSIGINVYFFKLLAFAISGFFAGVAGVFTMYHLKVVRPDGFGAFLTIQFLLMILIGGRHSMLGPALGAALAMFAPEVINSIFGDVIDFSRQQMIFGGVLALTVLTAPNGIVGQTKAGFNAFFLTLRRSRERGRSWAVSATIALGTSIMPSAARRAAARAAEQEDTWPAS
jgi:branched-chain amino acid transport system permease protein